MATEKIRIKDIAERAGVSVGTVDRVLHERPNVSPAAREKVEKAVRAVPGVTSCAVSVLTNEMSVAGSASDAAIVAGMLHTGEYTIGRIKDELAAMGVPVRKTAV